MQDRLKRLKFRAWHRGTREADYMIGGFFDRYASEWGEDELAWFEAVAKKMTSISWPGRSAPGTPRRTSTIRR
jgi:Uncharacterized conserved protein